MNWHRKKKEPEAKMKRYEKITKKSNLDPSIRNPYRV